MSLDRILIAQTAGQNLALPDFMFGGPSPKVPGRRGAFFPEPSEEAEFVARVHEAVSKAGFWDEFSSDWFCLDCELMPWSAKARELIQRQYAAVGAAGAASLDAALKVVQESPAATGMAQTYSERLDRVRKYREAYRRYCWPVTSLADYRLAPFHLLASEGADAATTKPAAAKKASQARKKAAAKKAGAKGGAEPSAATTA